MLATIILDAYKKKETNEIKDSLEDLFSAKDPTSGWSSAGIYCYWNYTTKEVLYFGLTVDLCERFREHNGLKKVKKNSSKLKEIAQYFSLNEKLGFSIMVQSSLSQPFTAKLKRKYRDVWELNPKEIGNIGIDGKNSVQLMEGALIKAYETKKGKFPAWNKIGGSKLGQIKTLPEHWIAAQSFTGTESNWNVSKSTLRELHKKGEPFNQFELLLHGFRISDMSIEKFLKLNWSFICDEIVKCNYIKKVVQL